MFTSMWGKKAPTTPSQDAAVAQSRIPSASSPPSNGNTLFSGLSVKAVEAPSGSKLNAGSESAFGFIGGASSERRDDQPPVSAPSAFSFLSPPSQQEHGFTNSSPHESSAATGFSFLNSSSPTTSQDPVHATKSGFGFLSNTETDGQASAPVRTAPEAVSKSGFSFMTTPVVPVDETTEEVITSKSGDDQMMKRTFSGRSSSSEIIQPPIIQPPIKPIQHTTATPSQTGSINFMAATGGSNALASPAGSLSVAGQPIRKKKITAKRPGYARVGGEYEDELAAPSTQHSVQTQQPQAVVVESSSSILAGLTIYVDPVSGDGEQATQQDLRAKSPDSAPVEHPPVVTRQSNSVGEAVVETKNESIEAPAESPRNKAAPPGAGFEQVAANFSQALARLDDELDRVSVKEHTLRERREALLKNIDKMLETQERSMMEEDFEKAERLQVEMDSAKQEISSIEDSLGSIFKEYNELDARREELQASQLFEIEKQVDETDLAARQVAAKAAAAAQSVLGERGATKRKLDERETSLHNRIESAKADLQVSVEEVNKLKDRISSGTVDLREERDLWDNKIKEVEAEIAELEKQLAVKRAERESHLKHLIEAEEKVQAVASKYGSRLAEAEKHAEQCQGLMDRLVQEQVDLETSKKEAETRLEQEDARVASLEQTAASAKAKLSVLESLLDRLKRDNLQRRKRMGEAQKDSRHLQTLQEEHAWKQSRVQLLEKDLTKLEVQLVEDGRIVSESAKELPELDTQKQLFVSMRNFKEAGRVANEIKALQANRQDAQKRLEESKIDLEEKRSSLKTLNSEIDATKSEIDKLLAALENDKLESLEALASQLEVTIHNIEIVPDEALMKPLATMMLAEHQSVTKRVQTLKAKLGERMVVERQLDEDTGSVIMDASNLPDDGGDDDDDDDHLKLDMDDGVDDHIPMSVLEKLLDDAVQDEDFDLAEQISLRIDRMKFRQARREEQDPNHTNTIEENPTQEGDAQSDDRQILEASDGLALDGEQTKVDQGIHIGSSTMENLADDDGHDVKSSELPAGESKLDDESGYMENTIEGSSAPFSDPETTGDVCNDYSGQATDVNAESLPEEDGMAKEDLANEYDKHITEIDSDAIATMRKHTSDEYSAIIAEPRESEPPEASSQVTSEQE